VETQTTLHFSRVFGFELRPVRVAATPGRGSNPQRESMDQTGFGRASPTSYSRMAR
jgi:hypothetical protein